MLARHLVHAQCERDGHHHRQPLGHGGDRQRDRIEHDVDESGPTQELQERQQSHQCQRDRAQALAEAVELNLQRRGYLFGRRQFLRQTAHLRSWAGRRDDKLGASAREQRVHVGHVEAIAERRVSATSSAACLPAG